MKYSNLILLTSILFCSCLQTDDIATSQPKETHIEIYAATDKSYAQSRADETFVSFGDGDNLGLYILSNGTTTPFAGNTNNLNIKATYKIKDEVESWEYVMQNSDYVYSSLYIASNDTTKRADFYAYSPWYSTNKYANSYMDYPNFNLDISANQVDLKWARQNRADSTINKGIVLNGTKQTVHFTFERATALISCKFATTHHGDAEGKSEIHIIGFTVTKGNCPLYKSGKLNITNGTWTKTEADSYSSSKGTLTLSTSATSDDYPKTYDIYFLPITQSEMNSSSGDDLMDITFNQYGNIEGAPATITLKKSQFSNGLEAGKKYTLYITWEDYLKIDNITVDEEWTDAEDAEDYNAEDYKREI